MIPWSQILLRLFVAAVLGGAVGVERERKEWAAGLRTHMMVCVGSALTMMVSAFGFHDILGTGAVVLDPSRIAAQVISGIGFIGAGTILFLRQEVIRGLTTAAGLWTVAAIGLATGGGMYFAAGSATIIVLIILWLLKPLERRFFARYRFHLIRVEASADAPFGLSGELQRLLAERQIELYNLSIEKGATAICLLMRVRHGASRIMDTASLSSLVEEFQRLDGVRKVSWDKPS